MEDLLYDEIDSVMHKIHECELNSEPAPIAELYFAYTVSNPFARTYKETTKFTQGDVISRHLFGTSINLVSAPDYIERSEQMRAFTKGIWFAIHVKFVRYLFIAMPRWIMALLSDEFVRLHLVCHNPQLLIRI